MKRPDLTVLTTPVLPARLRLYRRMRRAVRPLLKPGVPLPPPQEYPGHYAVTRSVVEGLRAIGADFNFNPRTFGEIGPVVYAPANEALLQAVALKRRGAIEWLAAGPVNALFADEADAILRHPEIDRLIIASAWAAELLDDARLRSITRVCPAGVNAGAWKPTGASRDRAVVYWKNGTEGFCQTVENVLRRFGLEPIRFSTAHGDHRRFTASQFRDALDRSVLAVFLSAFETQGIALAEAWSMDVPTLVWDPQGEAEWRGWRFTARSSCPYLTGHTGRAWRTLEEFERVLVEALREPSRFAPRRWVLEHMTDAVCARQLLDAIAGPERHRVDARAAGEAQTGVTS